MAAPGPTSPRSVWSAKGPGRYNLYLGAAFDGSRLNKLYAEDLEHDAILTTLDPLFSAYAQERSAASGSATF
jgi:sulfite reductase (NADPH) hemoprotein beta-component